MTLRQTLLLASSVCLVSPAFGCGPQVDAESPGASGGSTTEPQAESSGSTGAAGSESVGVTTETQGVTTTPPDPSSGAGETTTTSVDTSSGSDASESSTGTLPTLDCDPLCELLIDGSCLGEPADCLLACETTVRDQGQAVADAFATCVATEYLCFSLLEDCMWSEVYGSDPVEQQYVFEGEGFDAWNGRTVFAQVTGGSATSPTESAVIVGGGIVLETSLTTTLERFGNSRNVHLFVDANDDGACTPGIDHAQTVWTYSLGSEFSEPSFVIPGTPTKLSSDSLCDQF